MVSPVIAGHLVKPSAGQGGWGKADRARVLKEAADLVSDKVNSERGIQRHTTANEEDVHGTWPGRFWQVFQIDIQNHGYVYRHHYPTGRSTDEKEIENTHLVRFKKPGTDEPNRARSDQKRKVHRAG